MDIYDDWIIPFRESPVLDEGVRMASLKDLAAFKLTAFTERREKKDYVDLFFLFKKFGGLSLLIDYPNYNPQLSPKSLLFALEEAEVAEANQSPMPDMLLEVRWNAIKDCMHKAAKEYLLHLRKA